MNILSDPHFKMRSIFDPDSMRKRLDLVRNGSRLVHYTSAAVALSIIRHKEVWMRNVRLMNDFGEVRYGMRALGEFFASGLKERNEFVDAMDSIRAGLANDVLKKAGTWTLFAEKAAFITCLSEHPNSESQTGRLSMWRAYGAGSVGVAVVMNPTPFYGVAKDFGAYSYPVRYMPAAALPALFSEVTKNILQDLAFLRNQPEHSVKHHLFELLFHLAIGSKHPAFAEELEWRIAHVPALYGKDVLSRSRETIGGIPQIVYKIPLVNRPDLGITGIEVGELVDEIIIGPTNHPDEVKAAFVDELVEQKIQFDHDRIRSCGIPLRVTY